LFFGYAGYTDTQKIVDKIYAQQSQATHALLDRGSTTETVDALSVYAALEIDTITARNNRAASLLTTRTWIRFFTTMSATILIVLGAAFVLGRITTDAARLEADAGSFKGTLATTSPGLVLVVIGGGLLTLVLSTQQELRTRDGASFGQFFITDSGDAPVRIALLPFETPSGSVGTVAVPSNDEISRILERRLTQNTGE